MKRLLLIATLLMASVAQAQVQAPAWQQELEQYKVNLEQVTPAGLHIRQGFYIGMAIATCTAGAAVTAATFVTDTVPVRRW